MKVVLLPEGQDPDDFARRHTLDEVQDHIARNEQDFIAFKTDLLLGEAGNDPLKRATLINDIADTISLIPDAIKRAVYIQTCAVKFGVDEQILTDRVSRSRTDMILAEQKEKERARQREENRAEAAPGGDVPPPPSSEDYEYVSPADMPDVPVQEDGGIIINERYLAPCEKELLEFILLEGCTELDFDRDSKFYIEGETINVAEFIDGILADDDAYFVNVSYRKVYDEYFRMYDEGLTQEQIRNRLLNSMDMEIAAVAKDLLIEKHQLTVKNYEQSLTAASTRLVMYVPKTLLTYQLKKVELFQKELTAELARTEDPERQFEIMTRIGEYNKARTRLNNELGRV